MHNSVGVVWRTAPAEGIWKVIRVINPKFFTVCHDALQQPVVMTVPALSLSVSRQKNNTTCLSCQLIRWNLIVQPQISKRETVLKSSPYYVDYVCFQLDDVQQIRSAAHSRHLSTIPGNESISSQSVQPCILTVLSVAVIQFCYVFKVEIKLGVQTVTQVQSIHTQQQQQYFFHRGALLTCQAGGSHTCIVHDPGREEDSVYQCNDRAFAAASSLIEWHSPQGQAGAKSYFLLTCAASRPQNLHTNCLYTSRLRKRRSSSLIFPTGNMKKNLFACRKGHKGMSNMISGILLHCVNTLGMLFSIFAKGQIISAHCVPIKVKHFIKCESGHSECADGV